MIDRQRFAHSPVHSRVALAALTVLLLAASACQPRIQIVQPQVGQSPLPAVTVTPALHNIAIIGVDFDPPLDSGLFPASGVTLLVAVENQGLSVEPAVTVTAKLLDPAADVEQSADLLHETVIERELEPGQVRIVRFTEVTDLPARTRYQLNVELTSLEDDADLSDNVWMYDVLVGDEE